MIDDQNILLFIFTCSIIVYFVCQTKQQNKGTFAIKDNQPVSMAISSRKITDILLVKVP